MTFEEEFPSLKSRTMQFDQWIATEPGRTSCVYRPPRNWVAVDIKDVQGNCLDKAKVRDEFIKMICREEDQKVANVENNVYTATAANHHRLEALNELMEKLGL